MHNERPDRPAWMNDEQYAIYRELQKICNTICEALKHKDQKTWLEQTMRVRELMRLANQKIFTRF